MSFSELKLGEMSNCRNEMNAQNLFLNDEFGHFKEFSAKIMLNKVN
jgi:hypothetical protein